MPSEKRAYTKYIMTECKEHEVLRFGLLKCLKKGGIKVISAFYYCITACCLLSVWQKTERQTERQKDQ